MHSNRFLLWISKTCNKLLPDYKILFKESFVTFPAGCPCSQLSLYLQCRNTWNIYSEGRELVTLSKFLNMLQKAQKLLFVQSKAFPKFVFTYIHEKVHCVLARLFYFLFTKASKQWKSSITIFFFFSLLLVKSNSFGQTWPPLSAYSCLLWVQQI